MKATLKSLESKVRELYLENIQHKTDISILSGLIQELEERVASLEQTGMEDDMGTRESDN